MCKFLKSKLLKSRLLRSMAASLFFISLLSTNAANAAMVHLSGTTVDFYYDDQQPGMALYGSLSVVGDSIFADPTNFLATSTDGGVAGSASALGTVKIVAKSGYRFNAVAVAQQGDYQVTGAGASVTSTGTLTVEDFSNALTTESVIMTNSGFGVTGAATNWSSLGQFDLSTPTWDNVFSINLTLDSLLGASTSVLGESAFIQNKQVVGGLVTIETAVVPLPASVWLFATGLVGLLGFRKRKLS